MGASSKKGKDKESHKRRHEDSYDGRDAPKEKKHKHKKHHHKDKKRDKSSKYENDSYSKRSHESSDKKRFDSEDSDVVEIIDDPLPAPLPQQTHSKEGKHDTKSEARHESRSDTRHESRSESRYESRSELRHETRSDSRQELRSESRHESRSVEAKYEDRHSKATETKQNVESLSIEETNKLRAKLGMKLLEVSSSSNSSKKKDNNLKKDDLGEFYHKPATNLAKKAQQEKISAKLTEIKEKRMLHNKLNKVKGLGESDSDDDVESWVTKNREIEKAKQEAEKRAKMLEELDAQFGIGEIVESEKKEKMMRKYSEKDLKGMTVQHDVDSFAEERTVILTLKDKGVLEEDDDVLVNVNMIDDERYKKNIENKKNKPVYNAYEDDEFDEFGNPKEKSLLSKYDEEIAGEKKDNFKIGYDSAVERKQAAAEIVKAKLAKKKLESIAETNLKLASEYYNEEELAKFKKPKKRVRKMRSKGTLLTTDELKPDNKGIEGLGSRRPKIKNDIDYDIDDIPAFEYSSDIKLEDDNDDTMERALHKARKTKQKEDIISKLLKTEIKTETEDDNVEGGNITLNATAEFCRTLGDIPTYGKSGNREETNDILDYDKEIEKEENSDDDCEIVDVPSGWNSVDPTNQGIDSSQITPQEVQILGEEPDVSTGVGAALKLAMSKGYLDKEQNNRPSNTRLAHLQAKNYSIEDKSYGEDNDRQGRRERYSGPITEFKEKEMYKPNVKLEYIDDDGHILNSKEAFRYLSHKFHGKGPGKNKVEKRIKKGVQEQLMKKMSSTDTPLGTLNMLQAKQKETQSAFVVLSGNKHSQSTSLSKTRR